MQISAAISRGADLPFTIQDVSIADPRPGEVLVRLVATGICHTDLVTKRLFPDGTPVVLGHEGAGIVEQVGKDIDEVGVGDHVVLSFQSCAQCGPCRSGSPAYCEQFVRLNMSGFRADGSSPLSRDREQVAGSFFGQSSFATYALVTPRNLIVVADDVDLVAAAPFGCSMQTGAGAVVNVLQPHSSARIVVLGAGGVGMAAIMAARALGVEIIVAVDLNPERLDVAMSLGASTVVDGESPAVVKQVRSATGGGATHALDTTAVPAVITSALDMLAPRGELVLVGLGTSRLEIDATRLLVGGRTIRGCIEGDADPQTFIRRLVHWHREGKFPIEQIIRTYPFTDIDAAIADTAAGNAIKPVLVFDPAV